MGMWVRALIVLLIGFVARLLFAVRDAPSRLIYLISEIKRSDGQFSPISLSGRDVLLIAAFQRGELRNDMERLIQVARDSGFVVFISNTSRLHTFPPADYYEERRNYGRDFGAYKALMKKIFRQPDFAAAKTMTLLNDSVFYIPNRIPQLLDKVRGVQPSEALGLTDNDFEEYHLASYFVTVGSEILRDTKFQHFWNSYKLTNSRPRIIKKGEMGLSRLLITLVGRENVKSVFNYRLLVEDAENLDQNHLLSQHRESLHRKMSEFEKGPSQRNPKNKFLEQRQILGFLAEGAPAHGCIKAFLERGMPVMKLDIHYRGIADYIDLSELEQFITDSPARESFRFEVLRRGIGHRDLTGMQKLFYSYGLV